MISYAYCYKQGIVKKFHFLWNLMSLQFQISKTTKEWGPQKSIVLNSLYTWYNFSYWLYNKHIIKFSGTLLLFNFQEKDWPTVLIGLFIAEPTPFVQAYLRHISSQRYPKSKIDIFLHSVVSQHLFCFLYVLLLTETPLYCLTDHS